MGRWPKNKKLKEEKEEIIEPQIETPQVIEETPIIVEEEPKVFITTDGDVAFKLQNKFNVISAVSNENGRTFTFNASPKEVEQFLKEEKC